MHILALAAAVAAAHTGAAPVEHRVSIFQQDFPVSHQDGRREYERFVALDLFDASGSPRTVGLSGCAASCDYAAVKTAGDATVTLKHGDEVPSATSGGISYVLNGQKTVVSYAGGRGEIQIEDHHVAQGTGGTTCYSVLRKSFGGRRDDWSYYRTYASDGKPVMRLLVVWDDSLQTVSN